VIAAVSAPVAAGGPVIPNFGHGDPCVVRNAQFCTKWFFDNFGSRFAPRLVEHIELTLIAVGVGTVIAVLAAIFAYRHHWFETPFSLFSALLYTIPSLAFFEIMVQITGINRFTAEIALVSYTLLILFRNTLTGLQGVPRPAIEAANAMGLTARQRLVRVELPLALPAMMAGIRIATVTTISLTTVAAYIGAGGLGEPIFNAIQTGFKTQFLAAGILAILLALVADVLLVFAQRLLSPWTRAQRSMAR
jgi:osmoprotectant transport system permease protein